jgi:hypothetical protein
MASCLLEMEVAREAVAAEQSRPLVCHPSSSRKPINQ